jgi:hypothetical protein
MLLIMLLYCGGLHSSSPPHNNRVSFVLDACKDRIRAHLREHPPTTAVSLVQHVILFFYIPLSSKVVCVLSGRIGIGNLPGQLHPFAVYSATVTPSRPLVDHLIPTKTAVPKDQDRLWWVSVQPTKARAIQTNLLLRRPHI